MRIEATGGRRFGDARQIARKILLDSDLLSSQIPFSYHNGLRVESEKVKSAEGRVGRVGWSKGEVIPRLREFQRLDFRSNQRFPGYQSMRSIS